MKVIHTFYPILHSKLYKDALMMMSLSALLAKKHFGNIHLYCDEETKIIVEKIGIPYDSITTDIFIEKKMRTFSIPKIIVYSQQTEPFIHIDLDTFVFKHFNFDDDNKLYCTFKEGSNKMINLEWYGAGLYNTYIEKTFKIRDRLDDEFIKHINFYDIANMSLFGGNNFELIKQASEYVLNIYENNQDFFDSNYYNSCIIEQLFISSAIKMFDNQVQMESLFIDPPLIVHSSDNEYPFKIISNGDIIDINNDVDLYKLIGYDFKGLTHLNGYKSFSKILFVLEQKLLFEFEIGKTIIENINKECPEIFEYQEISKKYHKFLKNKLK